MTIQIVNHSDSEAKISNFSKERYVSRDYMASEWDSLWRNTWLLAGLMSDVQRPGDYFVFDLGREEILVCRDLNHDIQGYYNVCQHRGNRLVCDERGHASSFRCAYHAWSYDVNGNLKSVPYEERFTAGVAKPDKALPKVRTETWNGFVFVHLGDDPVALSDFLGPVKDLLAPYRFGEMTLVEDQTVKLQCNWKAVVDNFSELYHVDFLHPQHKRMVDCCNDTVHLFNYGHTGLAVPGATVSPRFPVPEAPTDIQSFQLKSLDLDPDDFHGRVLDIREAVQQQKRKIGASRGMNYDQFTDEQLSDVWQYNLFPNTILSFTPEHCWVLRPRPHPDDPSRCVFDKMSLVMFADKAKATTDGEILGPGRPAALSQSSRPQRDVFDYRAVVAGEKTMTDTIDQDVELLGGVQKGMQSHGFHSVYLNDDEMRIQHFHNQLDAMI